MKYVMFGNQRHASIYALRNNLNPKDILIATRKDALTGVNGPVKAIRLPTDIWKPTTFSCENRVKEAEAILKLLKREGGIVMEEEMSL
ncbi:hypothetical protein PP914_gp162 [Arthrobacter phage Qui]|uniref:Uncharacterized protein n=1 Tax=Arthrobacter phage Qui TaxID=2603260 RepID=A0A5B8WFR0_9CAUD|nr:hypothetical protein PP914_gp162 [Arthrobacter phage Qui]QED11650.1 hypothetical protein SEA_QUI_162 [Arthrobacter phage Qui]QOC56481.1 hypothetical protein SEA_PAELLA_162 [Arthrobacter phage Paella]